MERGVDEEAVMPDVRVDRKFLVRDITEKTVAAGLVPVEFQRQFEESLTQDVEKAVKRFSAGIATNLVQAMILGRAA